MDRFDWHDADLPQSLLSMILGFVGVTALILLLPRTVKYVIRRFVFGIVGEIVAVVITGLLTEKLVDVIAHDHAGHNGQHRPDPARRRPSTMP